MDIFKQFAHITEEALNTGFDVERFKVSLNLRSDDVYAVDRLAKALGMTRQDVISSVLHAGLPDAFRGYFKIVGNDPLETMTLSEYIDSLQGGDMPGVES
ncbi:MAG: hypothetical protein WCD31_09845 [Gillisia sp.]